MLSTKQKTGIYVTNETKEYDFPVGPASVQIHNMTQRNKNDPIDTKILIEKKKKTMKKRQQFISSLPQHTMNKSNQMCEYY